MTSQPFGRTLRSLRRERSGWTALLLAGVAALLALWLTWFFTAEVPVFAATDDARLEVGGGGHSVAAPLDGVLAGIEVELGESVEAGDVLLELDAGIERAELREAEARNRSAANQLATREAEKHELESALDRAAEAASLRIREARVRSQAGARAAEAAAVEAGRAAELRAHGLISDQELERSRLEAERRGSEARELALAWHRERAEWDLDRRDRRAELEALDHEIAELRGLVESTAAAVDRLRESVGRHSVRAPASGTVVEIARLGPGAVLEAGQPMVVVIPSDQVHTVARFTPAAALGRIQPGQPAELRFPGFPWTEFGTVEAEVRSVGGELRDGSVVVVLELAPREDRQIPIRHGLPTTVAVQVEEVSPAALLLRSLGRSTSHRAAGAGR